MNGKVSVIVPVYNVEPYLRRCIDSILAQSYQNFEILLIDDGSTDASGDICDKYAEQDSRIFVIHQENKGVSSARNAGLDRCCGEYVSFIDSDDWIDKEMLQTMTSAIEETCADFAVCNEIRVYQSEKGMIEKKINHWKDISGITKIDIQNVYRKIYSRTGILCNKVYKHIVIGENRFDVTKSYGEDVLFQLAVFKNTAYGVIVPNHYYYYNIDRPGNVISSSVGEKSIELLNNTEQIFRELSARGYADVGIIRTNIAIAEVIQKIPRDSLDDPAYKKYILACKKLAGLPTRHEVALFLKSDVTSLKIKCAYLLKRTDFSLWIKVKQLMKK